MPTYDYRCDACQHTFEEFQSITAKSLRKCPACGKSKLKRLIGTGAGIIFKGSGFYETDYRSDSYKQAAKADSDKGKSDSGSSTSTDSATKSETPAKTESAKPAAAATATTTKPEKKSDKKATK